MTFRLKSRTAENSWGKGLSPRFVPRRRQSFRKYCWNTGYAGATTAYTFKLHVSRKDNAHNHQSGFRNPRRRTSRDQRNHASHIHPKLTLKWRIYAWPAYENNDWCNQKTTGQSWTISNSLSHVRQCLWINYLQERCASLESVRFRHSQFTQHSGCGQPSLLKYLVIAILLRME